ncbi:hypothetical protein [Pseudooceanicola sp. MF1-13]|uniref:hypothetical protein n=1 Tax=Pseudooceanicola sp. MF1-13 TaxID=3379095 RepID=UPI003891F9DD
MTSNLATTDDVARLETQIAQLTDLVRQLSPEPGWMTVKEAAESEGVSISTINRRVDKGEWTERGTGSNRRVKARR